MQLRRVLPRVLAPLLLAGVVLSAGYWVSARTVDSRSALNSALDVLPADSLVTGFTDWDNIRQRLDLGDASTAAARAALNDDAALRDLSTRSVLGRLVEETHTAYGWSVADLDWEVYGQAQDGAAMVGRFSSSVSLSAVRSALRRLKYVNDDGVWSITGASPVSGELASTLGSIAIVPGERLVIASSRPTYVMTVRQVVDRDQPSLLGVREVSEIAGALVGSDSALIQSSAFACTGASLEKLSDDVQAQAGAAVARAGALADLTFAGRGIVDVSQELQKMTFAMGFESPSEAVTQLRTRTALARGAFIGGSGRVEDSLRLTSSGVEGATAVMRFDHDPVSAAYMGGGDPLLFASCPTT